MQARRRIIHIRREETGKNALKQPSYTEVSRGPRSVFGWHPTSEEERRSAALAGRTVSEKQLMMPDDDYGPNDQVILPGDRLYDVDGEVEDYSTGPFSDKQRYTVGLRRVANA